AATASAWIEISRKQSRRRLVVADEEQARVRAPHRVARIALVSQHAGYGEDIFQSGAVAGGQYYGVELSDAAVGEQRARLGEARDGRLDRDVAALDGGDRANVDDRDAPAQLVRRQRPER